ncbi:hypothetical protein H6F76_09820 [Leptolyngbya sp. FACHB-321]|uniref:hypothetical protein n=1 Tax=Leptolyngbya sp. FACHB-321 TaxID=2692807 RepID=UPI00168619D3|nr:hypothetical protein [Leptolyngbya sp. FACHB-321]MBD2035320.1 hypothetical protein [Leptolyngbya sp. FACHB-321]
MKTTQNRYALVYDHQNVQGWLKVLRISDNLGTFPDSVQVGDPFQGQPIVALAADLDSFAHVLKDENALCEQGKKRFLELQPQQQWRYYLLFRFYIRSPMYATTVEEKVAIALLGETQTLRVVGSNDPDAIEVSAVWRHLQQYETALGTVLEGGPLDGVVGSRFRSLDTIDTQSQQYREW